MSTTTNTNPTATIANSFNTFICATTMPWSKKKTHTHTHTKLKLKWNAHWQNRV
jgi:hypothetical protein